MQKRQQQHKRHGQRCEEPRRFRLHFLTKHRQENPRTVIDQRRDQQRTEQREGVGRAGREHEKRLGQQVDDQRRVVVEPGLIDGGTHAGEHAVGEVGFQPHLQIVVGGVVPQVEALTAHHGVQVERRAGRNADTENDGICLCQLCADGPRRTAVEAEHAQHRRAGEQQQPDIHRIAAAAQHIHGLQPQDKMRRGAAHKLDCKHTQQNQDGPLQAGHPAIQRIKFRSEFCHYFACMNSLRFCHR